MNRRSFLGISAALTGVAATSDLLGGVPVAQGQQKEFAPRPGAWRTFEVTTRAEMLNPSGVTRVWLPIPVVQSEYQRTQDSTWTGNARVMRAVTESKYGASVLYAEFAEDEKTPVVELTSRFQTQDRALDWSRKGSAREDPASLRSWTQPTDLMPTDGIVRETALEITRGKSADLDKVKAVYDWVLANTYREPKVRGCGVGDIKAMLETRNFGGKCGDINGLFVGLCRAAGVPAGGMRSTRTTSSTRSRRERSKADETSGRAAIEPPGRAARRRRRAASPGGRPRRRRGHTVPAVDGPADAGPRALQDPAGRRHSLADYRGMVVLVNFWATWCDPCCEEMPSLTRLLDRLAGRPFAILGVNYGESAQRVGQFLERVPTGFPILLDPNQDAPRAWRVRILPESFLVDGAGRVRYRMIGEIDWLGPDALGTISKLLREIG